MTELLPLIFKNDAQLCISISVDVKYLRRSASEKRSNQAPPGQLTKSIELGLPIHAQINHHKGCWDTGGLKEVYANCAVWESIFQLIEFTRSIA